MFDSNPVSGYGEVEDEQVARQRHPVGSLEVASELYYSGSKAPPAMAMIRRADPVFV